MRSDMGSLKSLPKMPLPSRCESAGFGTVQQRGIVVFYDDVIVGEFAAGLLVEDQVIVELKLAGELSDVRLRNEGITCGRRASPPCLPINFGRSKVEIRRIAPSFACSVPSLACSFAQA
jgi:GxxExxY protein